MTKKQGGKTGEPVVPDASHYLREAIGIIALSRSTEGERFLFPFGINHIKLELSLDPSKPSLLIDVSGPGAASGPIPAQALGFFAETTVEVSRVLAACRKVFNDVTKKDCNKFVKAVVAECNPAANFGPGDNADKIIERMRLAPWTPLGDGDAAAATEKAKAGFLVIAGATSGEMSEGHGHVVIIHSPADTDGIPMGSWGTISTVIDPAMDPTRIRKCFRQEIVDDLHYSYVEVV